MKTFSNSITSLVCALAIGTSMIVSAPGEARAERLAGSVVDNRVVVAFKVEDNGLSEFLPDGWKPVPFPRGAYKGGNLLVAMIDREITLDAEGKPNTPASTRHVALAGVGKEIDGDRVHLFVYKIYETSVSSDPFGNSEEAAIHRKTSTEGDQMAGRARSEAWVVQPQGGGEITVSLDFVSGKRSHLVREITPHSAVDPSISQIWRDKQLIDLLMSVEMDKPLNGEFSFTSSVPELSAVFDGSEQAVAILDIPSYVRDTYLP